METTDNNTSAVQDDVLNDGQQQQDSAHDDQIGENAGDSELSKGGQPNEQSKPDNERVDTVVPDNDSGDPGPPAEEGSSNKGQGPSGENL